MLGPVLLLIGLVIFVTSPGPLLVKVPHVRRDGRLAYVSAFRVRYSFSAENHALHAGPRASWTTPVGMVLKATGMHRLPVLLDIRAGRLGFVDAFLG